MRGKALVLAIAATVVVIVAGGLGGLYLGTDVTYQTVPSIPPVTPSVEAAVSPTTQSAAPSAPPLRHDPVVQAMPTRLTVWREGEDPILSPGSDSGRNIAPNPAVADDSTGIVSPSSRDLLSVQNDLRLDWAVLPGTGVGTTILLCHTLADSNLPCNALGIIPPGDATSSGYRALLELPTGALTYELSYVNKADKTRSKDWPVLFTKEPDRLLIGMCRLDRDPVTGELGNTYEFSFLEFHLIESVSR